MGIYLNNTSAYGLFQEDYSLTYYVDKSDMIRELVPVMELKWNGEERAGVSKGKNLKYLAITRPRRFGKTVMANMIAFVYLSIRIGFLQIGDQSFFDTADILGIGNHLIRHFIEHDMNYIMLV